MVRSLLLLCLSLVAACSAERPVRRPAAAAPGPRRPLALKVVTFNVQDLFVASRRPERMRAIGRRLGALRPDFIGLQEAFDGVHRAQLEAELERVSGLSYEHRYFPSGVMGSGLHVLTPHRVERASFWRYSRNGAWYQVRHGDFYAGKGAAMVRLGIDGVGSVDCFNTHCIASYRGAPYREDRAVQLQELAAFVEAEATTPAPAIVLGDLNAPVGSPEYAPLAAGYQNLTAGRSRGRAGRIDHVLVRGHEAYEVTARGYQELWVGADDRGEPLRLSDHAGLVITVELRPTRGG
ncbi:MAG: endonuclease/exonuclease/phosphatase family protein [Planctomycetota bacterium]